MRFPLPSDPTRRAFAVAAVCSILLHILLLGSLVWVNTLGAPLYAKRGEALIVDIAPDRPEEKAPLGNPARPPAPPAPVPPRAAEPPAPKPKASPSAPKPPTPPKASPPRPEPAQQVAKAAPPAPEPPATAPAPPPEPQAPPPQPQPSVQQPSPPTPRESQAAPSPQAQPDEAAKPPATSPSPAPSAGSEGSGSQTALAKPPSESPPSIFRYPGGGGLHGGRGGAAGEPIPLDTPDPNYREYMEKVKQRIYAKWGYPYEAQARGLQGKLVIEFHIAKDGHLQFIELRQTSGEEILDSFALTAVKLAQIYPPLPDAMRRDVLPIVAVFIYTLRGPLSVLQSLQ